MIEFDDKNKPFIKTQYIQHITIDDVNHLYKHLLKSKPIQLSINSFYIGKCDYDNCYFEGILHKKQTFCPLCKHLVSIVEEDANYNFDDLFQQWNKKIKYIERIVTGKVKIIELAKDDSNDISYTTEDPHKKNTFAIGEEVFVDG